MKSSFATEQFVRLFGTPPVEREKPSPRVTPGSSTMIPKLAPAPGDQVVYHVMPRRKDGRWSVKKEGGSKPSAVCATKELAIEAARGFAQSLSWARVVIHNLDGKVSQEMNYGTEPEGTGEPTRSVGDWGRDADDDTEVADTIQDS